MINAQKVKGELKEEQLDVKNDNEGEDAGNNDFED